MSFKYPLPPCLRTERINEPTFRRWLTRKAFAHAKRDRRRGIQGATFGRHKEAIYRAVVEAKGRDYYTGKRLDWHRVSRWDNVEASRKKGEYKKKFWNLPTADHDFSKPKRPVFRLCSWRLNDSKNDQTIMEFLELAAAVRAHLTGR